MQAPLSLVSLALMLFVYNSSKWRGAEPTPAKAPEGVSNDFPGCAGYYSDSHRR